MQLGFASKPANDILPFIHLDHRTVRNIEAWLYVSANFVNLTELRIIQKKSIHYGMMGFCVNEKLLYVHFEEDPFSKFGKPNPSMKSHNALMYFSCPASICVYLTWMSYYQAFDVTYLEKIEGIFDPTCMIICNEMNLWNSVMIGISKIFARVNPFVFIGFSNHIVIP